MNITRRYLVAALSPALAWSVFAQTPPPVPRQTPPPAPSLSSPQPLPAGAAPQLESGGTVRHSGRVSSVVYGPQGEMQAFTLRDGVAVNVPPELAARLQSLVSRGSRVHVVGTQRMNAGQASLIAESITANGQTFVASPPLADRAPSKLNPDAAMAAGAPPPPPPPPDPRAPRGVAGREPGAPPSPSGPMPPLPPRSDSNPPPPPPVQNPGIPAQPRGPASAQTPEPQPAGATALPAPSSDTPPPPPQM